jgi:hypothetical protein
MLNQRICQHFHVNSTKREVFFNRKLFDLELIVQALLDAQYLDDTAHAQKLSCILGLPHFHHHEKRSVTKTASSISLSKQGLHPSPSFVINNLIRRGWNSFLPLVLFSIVLIDDDSDTTQEMSAPRLVSKPSSHDLIPTEHEETTIPAPSAKVREN